ncbi:hypothetical protein ACRALDRAFT_213193 [Sodiomyces alcalophilus JCM 7366]|uniref:uncharacterized protein n=1 Tax=Sodiomyces alcalophilus JCM 7366 TaxID=591952 RepID=UPI0039B3C69C
MGRCHVLDGCQWAGRLAVGLAGIPSRIGADRGRFEKEPLVRRRLRRSERRLAEWRNVVVRGSCSQIADTIRYVRTIYAKMKAHGKAKMLLVAVLAALSQRVVAEDWTQKLLFHGTSLILRPDYSNHEAANHTVISANFYSYFGQTGYISFGWSVGGYRQQQMRTLLHATRITRYQFDWFEYTTSKIDCTRTKCRAHMVNWDNVPKPQQPFLEEDYVFRTVTALDDDAGRFHLGYFDGEGGALAVGTARPLSFGEETEEECRKALRMLRRVQATRGIELPFELSDVCGTVTNMGVGSSSQKPLALPWVGLKSCKGSGFAERNAWTIVSLVVRIRDIWSYERIIHDNPAVRRTLFFTGLVVLAEPLAATMLLSFPWKNELSLSVADTILTASAFFVAQVFTAPLYGAISDRFGRKPVLLFGLTGSAMCTILYGISGNLTMAIVSRALCNAGVSRTSVGELATNNGLHQGRAFSIFGLCTAMGTLLGPLVGGFLCQPAEKYGFKGPSELFVRYPYLLPCAIGACYNLVVVGLCIPYLQETNLDTTSKLSAERTGLLADEETPLIVPQRDQDASTLSPASNGNGTRSLVMLIVGHATIALHAISFDEMYPAIAATRQPIGLGFSSSEIAKTLLFLSPVVLAIQFVGYPALSKRLTYATLWRTSSILFLVVYMSFPLTIELPNKSWLHVAILVRAEHPKLTLSAPPHQRGITVSFAQAAISASRAIGPTVAGALWSWGLSNGFQTPFDQNILHVRR